MVMGKVFRNQRFPRFSRRFHFLLFATLIFLIWTHLPAPPEFENNTRADRRPPLHDVEAKPHFLYDSQFRKNPDYTYETTIDNSLKKLQGKVLSLYEGNDGAEDTIWQIFLQGDDNKSPFKRGTDSIAFEQLNKEWKYKVRCPM